MSVLADLHMRRVRRLCCVACLVLGVIQADGSVVMVPQAQLPGCDHVHHIEYPRHEFSDFNVLPLCWEHHEGYLGVHGKHRLGFEKFWKVTQWQLLGVVTSMLLADRSSMVGG